MALSEHEIELIHLASLKRRFQNPIPSRAAKSTSKKRISASRRRAARRIRDTKYYEDPHCHWCGRYLKPGEATADHIFDVSQGGREVWSNIVVACSRCNLLRNNNRTHTKVIIEGQRYKWRYSPAGYS